MKGSLVVSIKSEYDTPTDVFKRAVIFFFCAVQKIALKIDARFSKNF
jgi:hypothetical protein